MNHNKAHTPHELHLISEFKFIRQREEAQAISIRRHEAAGNGRRFDPVYDQYSTPNTAVGSDQSTLRRRSLSALENNGHAIQAQRVVGNGIVGTGIKPSVRGVEKDLEQKILALWTDWAAHHQCDHYERETFVGLCQQIIDAVFATGEAIIRRRRTKDGGLQIQVHEGDYLDDSMSAIKASEDGSYTMHGIEYSAEGKTVAYWLFDSLDDIVPGSRLASRRIPATEVIHVFYAQRAGQRRGLPWMKAVMVSLMNLNRYMDADLQRAIVAACHAAFISGSPDGQSGFEMVGNEDLLERMEPGKISYLQLGEQVTFNSPPVHNSFDQYVQTQMRGIAAGIGITYESLSNDYSNVNFSSAKMGSSEMERGFFEKRERVMIYPLNRIWEWKMESLVLQGELQMSIADARKIKADWTAPKRAMIDAVKETEGLRLQIAAGLISPQEAIRQCGGDFDDIVAELNVALATFKGLEFTPTWAVQSMEINQLAIEAEAKATTAKASMKTASKPAPQPQQKQPQEPPKK